MRADIKKMIESPGVYVTGFSQGDPVAVISKEGRIFVSSGYVVLDPEKVLVEGFEGPYNGHDDPIFTPRKQDDDGSEPYTDAFAVAYAKHLMELIAVVNPIVGRTCLSMDEWTPIRTAITKAAAFLK